MSAKIISTVEEHNAKVEQLEQTKKVNTETLNVFLAEAKKFFTDEHGIVLRDWDESKFQRERFFTGMSPRNYFLAITRRRYEPMPSIDIGDIQDWADEVHKKLTGYLPVIEIRDSFIRIGLKRE